VVEEAEDEEEVGEADPSRKMLRMQTQISRMQDLPMIEVEAEVALRHGLTNQKFSAITVRSLDTTSPNVIKDLRIESMEPHMLQRKRKCKKPCFTPAMRLQNQPIQMCGCSTAVAAII
jgi:hypothetical protein